MPQSLADKLISMLADDQASLKDFHEGRTSKDELTQRVSIHTKIVGDIMTKHGIAHKDLDGKDVYKAMLVLILHSGDGKLMQTYLDDHEKLDGENVDISDRAIVTDKIRVISGEPQVYGTQYKISDHSVVFAPIENETDVDSRRSRLGLGPIGQFKKDLETRFE